MKSKIKTRVTGTVPEELEAEFARQLQQNGGTTDKFVSHLIEAGLRRGDDPQSRPPQPPEIQATPELGLRQIIQLHFAEAHEGGIWAKVHKLDQRQKAESQTSNQRYWWSIGACVLLLILLIYNRSVIDGRIEALEAQDRLFVGKVIEASQSTGEGLE
mgnify:CR=1 FL=1